MDLSSLKRNVMHPFLKESLEKLLGENINVITYHLMKKFRNPLDKVKISHLNLRVIIKFLFFNCKYQTSLFANV